MKTTIMLALLAGAALAQPAQAGDAAAIKANCANEHPGDNDRQIWCYEENMAAMREVLAVARNHPEKSPEALSSVLAACEAGAALGDFVEVARCFRNSF